MQVDLNKIIIVIPSYKPPAQMVSLVDELKGKGLKRILLVNDGSPGEYNSLFDKLTDVTILQNSINMGKGSALKVAFKHILHEIKDCRYVLSCDDDGQHSVQDIFNVAETSLKSQKDFIWLGSRAFDGHVPLKSRFGNFFMRVIFELVTGKKLKDTQTGLRCLPMKAIEVIVNINQDGFNFELIALLQLIQNKFEIKELPIKTIYFNQNKGTRFRSTKDSIKVVGSCIKYYLKK